MPALHARVLARHRAPDRPPVQLAVGDAATLGERDTEWPEFVWATLTSGLGGWIPAVQFDRERGEATAREAYDTRELDAEPGERLRLHHEMAGWWWAENERGACGWIPARALAILDGIEED